MKNAGTLICLITLMTVFTFFGEMPGYCFILGYIVKVLINEFLE
jgi:hypothetical protein